MAEFIGILVEKEEDVKYRFELLGVTSCRQAPTYTEEG